MTAPISQITIYSNASVLGSTLITVGTFPVDNTSERSATLRGENFVKICFKTGQSIAIPAFSFIEYDGQLFFIKETYRPVPKGNSYYEYKMKFVSFDNMLSKPHAYRKVVVDNETWNEPDIDVVGNLADIATIIKDSIIETAGRYEGVFADMLRKVELVNEEININSESKAFSYSGQKISQVLDGIANEYEIDYWFEQVGDTQNGITKMILHFAKCEILSGDLHVTDKTSPSDQFDELHPTVSGGLEECTFANEWSGVVQRITPFGSERNIKRGQAIANDMFVSFGKRLRLEYDHSCTINGTTYQHAYAVKNEDGNLEPLYVDENGAVYVPGVTTGEEDIKKYDDIYPRGHFRVTHVTQRGVDTQIYTVYAIPTVERNGQFVDLTDSEIDAMQADPTKKLFPIDIADGQTLSLHFESGFLNGREFEVANKCAKMTWENGAYKVDPDNGHWVACFEINPEGDNNDSPQVPYGNLIPRGKFDSSTGYEGDMFAIFNMDMPSFYIEDARNELAQKAYDEIVGILSTRPEVKCKGNEVYFKNHSLFLGQRIFVKSDLFGQDNQGLPLEFVSRVTNYSHPLSKPNNVDFRLCSSRVQGAISVIKGSIADQTNNIMGIDQTARSLSRRAFRDAQEMINMLQTVEAEMMVVGVERNQFQFTMGIECLEATVGGVRRFDGLKITAGEIQHTQEPYIKDAYEGHYSLLSETTLKADHNGNAIDKSATQTYRDTPYYLYAVINSSTGQVAMELWATKKDGAADEAYLLLGILSSEFLDGNTSLRVFNKSNGFTQIAGGVITTEQLQDPTRQLIIDMSSNPPRIIAVRGAEIIGNIRFKSFVNEQGEDVLHNIETAAEAYADAIKDDLQNQIDGVVDSYFMEGIPTMDDTKKPLSDWKTEGGGTIDYERHEGDTYTNIKNYGDELKAEEWEQGRVYYGENYIGKTLDESKSPSTDSNHEKGVRFSRLIQYKAGDSLWLNTNNGAYDILIVYFDNQGKQAVQNYYAGSSYASAVEIALNSSYTKFSVSIRSTSAITTSIVPELAICVNPKAGHSWRFCRGTGESPSGWHWHEIADSDAVKALQDAAQAQDTADGKRRCFITQPVPPYDPGDLWANATYSGGGVTYNNVLLKCKANCGKAKGQSFAITDWEDSSRAISTADDAKAAADDAMDKANDIANDGIISGGTEKGTLKKEFVEIAGEDYGNNNTSPLRTDGSYRKALAQATEYGLSSDAKVTALTSAYTTLRNAMKIVLGTNAGGYIDCSNLNNDTYVGADYDYGGETGIESRYDITFGGRSYDKDEFIALWKNYYDAEIALLNLVSDVIDTREIGGENLLYVNNLSTEIGAQQEGDYEDFELTYYSISSGVRTHTYLAAGKYVFSYKGAATDPGEEHTDMFLKILAVNQSGTIRVNKSLSEGAKSNVLIELPENCYIALRAEIGHDEGGTHHPQFTISDMQLQQGTKSTAYQNYMEHLANAIKGTTDINGGLVMLNVLMLKNELGNVIAGMSGLQGTSQNPENVLMWGGATYQQALNAALHDYFLSGTSGQLITTLLKKDGTGKIGCFRIIDKDTVAVITDNSTIYITNKSISDVSAVQQSYSQYLSAEENVYDGDADKSGSQVVLARYRQYVSAAGKYNIYMPQTSVEVRVGVESYPANPGAYPGQTDSGYASAGASATVFIRVKSGNNVLYTSASKSVSKDDYTDDGQATMHWSNDTASIASKSLSVELPTGNVDIEIVATYSLSASASSDTSVHAAGDSSAELSVEVGTVKIIGVDKYCVVAKDGIAVIANSNSAFYVQNDLADKLKVIAKGLPTSNTNLDPGQLYASGGYLRIA